MLKSVVVALALFGFSAPAFAAPAVVEGRAEIIDGDTIAIEGFETRIRLASVDAPESSQPCYDAAGKRYLCGSRAAEALAEIIGRNGRVRCVETDRDRYRRIVAQCFAGDMDINREMVLRGWAVEYKRYSDGRYAKVEAEAKAAKRGLWAGRFEEPSVWRHGGTGKVQSFAPMMLAASGAEESDTPGQNDYTVPDPYAADEKPLPATSATSCKSARTCRDAVILWCGGYSRADNDGDGIPCENVCRSRKQVDAIKKQVGCDR